MNTVRSMLHSDAPTVHIFGINAPLVVESLGIKCAQGIPRAWAATANVSICEHALYPGHSGEQARKLETVFLASLIRVLRLGAGNCFLYNRVGFHR